MLNAVRKTLPVDIAVCAAAVADFKPVKNSKKKIKKENKYFNGLKLEKNFDILDFIGKNNQARPKLVVGFSAETEDLIKNAKYKLKKKYCDLMVANDVSKKDSGFNVDYNAISIIDKSGNIESYKKNKKSYIASLLAKRIIDELLSDEKNIN